MAVTLRIRSSDEEQYHQIRVLFLNSSQNKIPMLISKGGLQNKFSNLLTKNGHRPKLFNRNTARSKYQRSWIENHDIFLFIIDSFESNWKNIQFPLSIFCCFGCVIRRKQKTTPQYAVYWEQFKNKMKRYNIIEFKATDILYTDVLNDMLTSKRMINLCSSFKTEIFDKIKEKENKKLQTLYKSAEKRALSIIKNELYDGPKLIDSFIIDHGSDAVKKKSFDTAFQNANDLNIPSDLIKDEFIIKYINDTFKIDSYKAVKLLYKMVTDRNVFDTVINSTNLMTLIGRITFETIQNGINEKHKTIEMLIELQTMAVIENNWIITKDDHFTDTLAHWMISEIRTHDKYNKLSNLMREITSFPNLQRNELENITKIMNGLFISTETEIIENVLNAYNNIYKSFTSSCFDFDFWGKTNVVYHKLVQQMITKTEYISFGYAREYYAEPIPMTLSKLITTFLCSLFNTKLSKFDANKKLIALIDKEHHKTSAILLVTLILKREQFTSNRSFGTPQNGDNAKWSAFKNHGICNKLETVISNTNNTIQNKYIINLLYILRDKLYEIFTDETAQLSLKTYLADQVLPNSSNVFCLKRIQQIQNKLNYLL